jgi:hypothetical protein
MPEDGRSAEPPPDAAASGGGSGRKSRERRLARHARHARMVWEDPRSASTLMRDGLLRLWAARGGGLYGLGYVVTFLWLEIRLVVSEFDASGGILDFVTDQLVEYLFRLGFMSLANMAMAFVWPALLLDRMGAWALVLLGLGYLAFEHGLRPILEQRFPELRRKPKASRKKRGARAAQGLAGDNGGDRREDR